MIFQMLWSALFISVVVTLALECWKEYLNFTKLKAFVHARGWPVLGNLIKFMNCDNESIFDFPNSIIGNRIGKLFYTWFGSNLIMFTDNPEAYEAILNSDKLLKKAFVYRFIRNSGILTSEPNIWRSHRRAIIPTLNLKMLNSFLPIFNEKAKRMVDLMEREIGKPVDMHRYMFNQALDVTVNAAYGVNVPMQNARGDFVCTSVAKVFKCAQLRFHSVWMKWDFLFQFTNYCKTENILYPQFHQIILSFLEMKRAQLAEKLVNGEDELAIAKEKNSQNLLHKCLQLEKEQKFDLIDIRDEMETILIGSSDTSAITIQGITLMLAIHQEYQERVMDELRSIFTDIDAPITNEHLSMMTFTELVIKESIRFFPIAPYIGRECMEDFAIMGGIIPKGAQVFLNIYKSNRNPKYWGENVNEFYPERFLPENSTNFHPYQYIPFSGGSRDCVGRKYASYSLKISLAYLLRRYKFKTNLKMHEVKVKTGLLLKIANENPVWIERRE